MVGVHSVWLWSVSQEQLGYMTGSLHLVLLELQLTVIEVELAATPKN